MNLSERRASIVDGTVERISQQNVDFCQLPKLDPFAGAVVKTELRVSLIDGTLESVAIVTLPPLQRVCKGREGSSEK